MESEAVEELSGRGTAVVAVYHRIERAPRLQDEDVEHPPRVRPVLQLNPIARRDVRPARDIVLVQAADDHRVWGGPGEPADVGLRLPQPQARCRVGDIVQREDGDDCLVLVGEDVAALGAAVLVAVEVLVAGDVAAARYLLADGAARNLRHRAPCRGMRRQ